MAVQGINNSTSANGVNNGGSRMDAQMIVFLVSVRAADVTQKTIKSALLQSELNGALYQLNQAKMKKLIEDLKTLKADIQKLNNKLKIIKDAQALMKDAPDNMFLGSNSVMGFYLGKNTSGLSNKTVEDSKKPIGPLKDALDALQKRVAVKQMAVGNLQASNEKLKNDSQVVWMSDINFRMQAVKTSIQQASASLEKYIKQNGYIKK